MHTRTETIAGRVLRALAAVAVAAFASVLMTWPLASSIGSLGRTQNSGDARYGVWNVAWVAHALATNPADLYDANFFYPHRNTLAYSEAKIGAGVLAIPVWLATGNPHAAFNTVVLLSFSGSLVFTWLLVRRLSGDAWSAAAVAPLFAFCPYLFSHLPHIQLLMCAGLPLSMLMLHRLVDVPSPSRGFALGAVLAAQALSCAYYGIFAGLMVGYATLFYAVTRRLGKSAAYWIAIGIAAAVALLVVLPFFLPYLRVQEEFQFRRSMADAHQYAAFVRSYLASAAHAHRWMLPLLRDWNGEVLFPGFLTLALAAVGVLTVRSKTSEPPPPGVRPGETALLYGSLGVLAFWTSLGPKAGLYAALYHTIPVFSFLRAPGRAGIVVMLALAVLAGFGARYLRSIVGERRRQGLAVTLCAVALVELNLLPVDWRRSEPIPASYYVLAAASRGAVAEFPFYDRRSDFHLHTLYMLRSTAHWQPLVNGYSDNIPGDFRILAKELGTFPSREAFRVLRELRVRYIAINRHLYGPEPAAEITRRLEPYMQYLRPLATDDRTTIFEVLGFPPQ